MLKLAFLLCLTLLEPKTLDQPMAADVFVRGATAAAQSEKVSGALLRYDADTFVIKTGKGERTLKWVELTASSAFTLRSRLIDKTSAADWLELGEFGWGMGAKDAARTAFTQAGKLDAALKPRIAELMKAEAGGLLKSQIASTADGKKGATQPATRGAPSSDLTGTDESTSPANATGSGAIAVQPGRKKGEQEAVVRYQPVSAEEAAKAIADAQADAAEVATKVGVKFAEIQTPHFILFTDWDPREHNFLKRNVEAAYTAVSKAFEMPATDNIFIGKLPVFMFARYKDFESFAKTIDGFPVTRSTAGYYSAKHRRSAAHMVMWKPNADSTGGDVSQAERMWAYVLTHEFTHAFVARYRTNQMVPRWLNEGTAEVVANGQFPREGVHEWARFMASSGTDIGALFDDDQMPNGKAYPIMMTMVEALLTQDRRKFLKYFNSIKDGKDPEQALKENYGVDYQGLAVEWRRYASGLK
jgi:hypothetical protein